ncbi:MAG: cobalamin-independent methionine synthase II family protein [Chloroflexi bacterium]|nr:MAG: cobalamin-independent methionine synthase II family protein [Chloroflexota bacterium]
MRRSTNRILVSHAGTLPRPANEQDLSAAVKQVVRKQVEVGIDIVNDGELSKSNFTNYVRERLQGIEPADPTTAAQLPPRNINARDLREFPEFFASGGGGFGRNRPGIPPIAGRPSPMVVTGPLTYVGQATVETDIANLKAAVEGQDVDAFLPAIAPGTVEHWLHNQYYKTDEEYVFALADALHQEYQAITRAGLNLQIDDPDLPDGWQMFPEMSVADYRGYAELRVEAINHALRDVPEEQVRLHVCWGSGLGPHRNDIALMDIIDIILKVKASVYSFEAANPRHQHEWRVWQDVKLPAGKSLMPGVIGHATDIVEHPRLVADRLIQYAHLVGKENVVAGTDCGVGSRVWNGEIAWAKFSAMAEGARIASKELWGS